jgi:hypothetical protein
MAPKREQQAPRSSPITPQSGTNKSENKQLAPSQTKRKKSAILLQQLSARGAKNYPIALKHSAKF